MMLRELMVSMLKEKCKSTDLEATDCQNKTVIGKLPADLATRYLDIKNRGLDLIARRKELDLQQKRIIAEMDIVWDDIRKLSPESANDERTIVSVINGEPIVSTCDCDHCTKFDNLEGTGL
jgi:hypothetical protein